MTKVNIIIGRFQPLTKGHMKCVNEAYTRGLQTVICMIDTPLEKVDARKPFPSTLLMSIYKYLIAPNSAIKDIILVKNADIVAISQQLAKKGYQIGSWTCGTDRYESYKAMADKYHDQANLPEDFEVIEIKRSDEDISATKARQALLDDNALEFFRLAAPIPVSLNTKGHIYDLLKAQLNEVLG